MKRRSFFASLLAGATAQASPQPMVIFASGAAQQIAIEP